MQRTFVIGDIHGAFRALQQCLSRANFDYGNDVLIALGDVSDGWPETRQSIDELLKIANLTYLLGNHDFWTLEWMTGGTVDSIWYEQGGKATIDSYAGTVPETHIALLQNARLYYVLNNKLFVHAGINPNLPIEQQSMHTLLWDRNFINSIIRQSKNNTFTTFEEMYVGHTPIGLQPVVHGEVCMMDTGAGWSGVLSMMDINTKDVFSSDPVPSLYPGIEGRKKK